MPELTELKAICDLPILYCRAEPDDEYPRPEPLDPILIDKYRYEDEEDEDEEDENNYSS